MTLSLGYKLWMLHYLKLIDLKKGAVESLLKVALKLNTFLL